MKMLLRCLADLPATCVVGLVLGWDERADMSRRAATICSRRFGNTDSCEASAKECAAFAAVIRGDRAGMTRRDFRDGFAGGRNAGQGPLGQPPLTIIAGDTIFPASIWRRLRLAIGFAGGTCLESGSHLIIRNRDWA